jgi:hypothetical protein
LFCRESWRISFTQSAKIELEQKESPGPKDRGFPFQPERPLTEVQTYVL